MGSGVVKEIIKNIQYYIDPKYLRLTVNGIQSEGEVVLLEIHTAEYYHFIKKPFMLMSNFYDGRCCYVNDLGFVNKKLRINPENYLISCMETIRADRHNIPDTCFPYYDKIMEIIHQIRVLERKGWSISDYYRSLMEIVENHISEYKASKTI